MDIDLKFLVFIVVCVVIVAFLVFARMRVIAWKKAFQELERYTGLQRQLDFTPDADLRKLEIFTRGSTGKKASNVIGGMWHSQPVTVFKYNYTFIRRSHNRSRNKETNYIISTRLRNVSMPDFSFKYIPKEKRIFILTAEMREDLTKMAHNLPFGRQPLPDRSRDIELIYRGFSQEVLDFITAKQLKGFVQVLGKNIILILEEFYIKPGEIKVIFSNFMELVKLLDAPGGFKLEETGQDSDPIIPTPDDESEQ